MVEVVSLHQPRDLKDSCSGTLLGVSAPGVRLQSGWECSGIALSLRSWNLRG